MKSSRRYECFPYFKLRKPSQRAAAAHADAAPTAAPWNLPDLCAAYNWPAGLAGGGVIAIVELGGGWVQSDMDSFFQSIDQPTPSITDVSVDGTENSPNQSVGSPDDPDYEVALDIEVAGASYYAATGQAATIRVYWSQDIGEAVQQATSDGCDVCTISWGSDEANWGNSAAEQMESDAEAATAAGMIVFAASGDNDSSDGGPTPANVDCPSSARMLWAAAGRTRLPPLRRCGTTTPAKPMARERVEAIRRSSPCSRFKLARRPRPRARHTALAAWFPTSALTPIPIPATRSWSTAQPPSWAAQARLLRSTRACLLRSEPSLGL